MIDEAKKLGFWPSSNIIVGFPDETREEVMESIQYVYDSSLDLTSFLVEKPNAGAQLYEGLKDARLLGTNLARGSDFYRSDYDTLHLMAKELAYIVDGAHHRWFLHKIKFYLHPRHFYHFIITRLRTIEDLKYSIKVSWVIFQRKILPMIRSRSRTSCESPLEGSLENIRRSGIIRGFYFLKPPKTS